MHLHLAPRSADPLVPLANYKNLSVSHTNVQHSTPYTLSQCTQKPWSHLNVHKYHDPISMYTKTMIPSDTMLIKMRTTTTNNAHHWLSTHEGLPRVFISRNTSYTNFNTKLIILAQCAGGVMWWGHGWACAFLRCLSGIVFAPVLIVRGSAFGARSVYLALWQPTCQPLASEMLFCIYVTVYIVLFPLENHYWLLGNTDRLIDWLIAV